MTVKEIRMLLTMAGGMLASASIIHSDVNKDSGLKAKAKDLTRKAKAKAKDFKKVSKAKAKDFLKTMTKDKVKDF